MARRWQFELGRARATARIGFDLLRSFLVPVSIEPSLPCPPVEPGRLIIRQSGHGRGLPGRARLLCWNIHRAYDAAGVAAGLRKMVHELAPDIVALQEVPVYAHGPWWQDGAGRELLGGYDLLFAPMHTVWRQGPYYPFGESGLLLAVRGGIATPAAVTLPAASHPKLGRHHRVERVAAGVGCLMGGVPVGIWNVHLENTARPSGRAHQARAVATAIGSGRTILCGDFNTMLGSFERVNDVLAEAGFARAHLSGAPSLLPQLDHLFVRGLAPRRAERLPIRGSDHAPIYGEFELES